MEPDTAQLQALLCTVQTHTVHPEPLLAFCCPWFVTAGHTGKGEVLMAVLVGEV